VARDLALAGAIGLATALGLLVIIGGWRGANNALHYALIDIPADQFWYFGTPALPFLGTWSEVFADQRMLLVYGAAATQAAVLLAWARQSPTGKLLGPPLFGGLAYGVVASVGYLSYKGYHFHLPLIRVELTIALVIAWRAVEKLRTIEPARFAGAVRSLQFGFAMAVLLAGPYSASSIIRAPAMVREIADAGRKFDCGQCRLSDRLAEHLDQLLRGVEANRTRSGPPSIWSDYAGLLEDRLGVFHPSHDYIIHARGRSGSDDYRAAFRAAGPEFAVTLRPSYYPHVEKQQAADWGFYEELFGNYEPVVRTSIAYLWKRRPGPWRKAPSTGWVSVPLDSEDAFNLPAIDLEAGAAPVVVVEVRYELHRSDFGALPILGQTPRYLLYPLGCHTQLPIPARPYADRMTFPAILQPGQPARFYAAERSLVGGRWILTAARSRRLAPDVACRFRETLN